MRARSYATRCRSVADTASATAGPNVLCSTSTVDALIRTGVLSKDLAGRVTLTHGGPRSQMET